MLSKAGRVWERHTPSFLSLSMLSSLILLPHWPNPTCSQDQWVMSSTWVSILRHRTGQRRQNIDLDCKDAHSDGHRKQQKTQATSDYKYLFSWLASPSPETVCSPSAHCSLFCSCNPSAPILAQVYKDPGKSEDAEASCLLFLLQISFYSLLTKILLIPLNTLFT